MSIYLGSSEPSKIYVGSNEVAAVYVGDKQVRPSSRLPSAYQEVEYIGSSGNGGTGQYIDTGVKKQSGVLLKVEADFYWVTQTAAYGIIYGVFDSNNSPNSYQFGFHKDGSKFLNYMDGTSGYATWSPSSYSTNKRYKLISEGTPSKSTNLGLFLMAQNENSSSKWCFNGRLYSCKIWTGGTLVRNFVPCYRKSDSVIGLYDLVNKQFYTNSGSGTFTKGPDVN